MPMFLLVFFCPWVELSSALRTEWGRSYTCRHLVCWSDCWACWLLFLTDIFVSREYPLSHLPRGFGFVLSSEKWVLNFIKCFLSISCRNCLRSKELLQRAGGWLPIYSSWPSAPRRWTGTVPQITHGHSSQPKWDPVAKQQTQTVLMLPPVGAPSACVARILRRTWKRKHPQKLEVGRLGGAPPPHVH